MNYTRLIYSCQAHLSVQYASDMLWMTSSQTWASLLFAPLAVHVQAGSSAFPFYAQTKSLIRLYFKYKLVLIPNLKMFAYILDIYNKM